MSEYQAPFYTETQLAELGEEGISYPFSDKDATYKGKDHQYELTSAYFQERGRNLEVEIDGNSPDKVAQFLSALRRKFYQKIYNTNKSTRQQLNFMIAKRGIHGYTPYEYRQAFLEAMFVEGEYLLDNGDISSISGVDFDTMQNMSIDVMRNQERDFHRDAIEMLKTLGLRYFGRYRFIPEGKDW
jgi:hypothetical protein